MAAAVESAFDIAYWFVDRALNDNEYLQPQKMHRLMYLSQAYFAVAYRGRVLMPGIFVADDFGPTEPNVFRACAIQRPAIEPRPFPEAVTHFLESIWRRFGPHSSDYLSRLTNGHPPYLEALAKGPRSEITLQAMVAFYGKKSAPPAAQGKEKAAAAAPAPAATRAESIGDVIPVQQLLKPRIMRSQSGEAVAVQKWMPPTKK